VEKNKMIFKLYSGYYDQIYKDKEYSKEIDFINHLGNIQPGASILDLGCGTGGHAIPFAQQGYSVTGVDSSDGMLKQAVEKAKKASLQIDFREGDIRTFRINKIFNLVISMFAVMGYQTCNTDVTHTFQTARDHLKVGGLFIFDAWYGPAVLNLRPETRVTDYPFGSNRVIRISKPEMDTLGNLVKVHYTILRLAGDRVLDEIAETHIMRYFFSPEVTLFAQNNGFKVVKVCPFMDPDRSPNEQDWNVTWVMEAV
jgi:SAM-dependent methyltransferase